ncbi:uncharacterized protein [Haliotis cracherodii]
MWITSHTRQCGSLVTLDNTMWVTGHTRQCGSLVTLDNVDRWPH